MKPGGRGAARDAAAGSDRRYVVRYPGGRVYQGRRCQTITTLPVDLAAAAAFVGASVRALSRRLRDRVAVVGEMRVVEVRRAARGGRAREVRLSVGDAREISRHWRSADCQCTLGSDAFARLILALHDAGGDR